jgi:hypothetical protein
MPEKPATDPAKPGSKLAQLQSMRDQGGIRAQEKQAFKRAVKDALEPLRQAFGATGKVKERGRPKIEGQRPWEAEGVSRRTWERRQKAKAK